MKKTKKILFILIIALIAFMIPNIVNAEVTLERSFLTNDGSMNYTVSGLTLDENHEYEFGIAVNKPTEIKNWYTIKEITSTTAKVDIKAGVSSMREVLQTTDIGYLTIKDKTNSQIVLEKQEINLKTPYLRVTNFEKLDAGYEFKSGEVNVPLRNAGNSIAFYTYEKVTDEKVINKYKEIKKNGNSVLELEYLIKEPKKEEHSEWTYFNGYGNSEVGYGQPKNKVIVPEKGLYYMWLYFQPTRDNYKDIYGCILIDNLDTEPKEIKVQDIDIRETLTLEEGDTYYEITPTFTPANASNQLVTWTSSDESVATIDNSGRITAIKEGSTLLTVTTQDGNKTDTCGLTVVKKGQKPDVDNTPDENIEEERIINYVRFPMIIFGGKGELSIFEDRYQGKYTLYYQSIQVTKEQKEAIDNLEKEYKEGKIKYNEYYKKYTEALAKYDENNWKEAKDGKFEIDRAKHEGKRDYALWVKAVMEDKTVYEVAIYTMDGLKEESGVDKETNSDAGLGILPQEDTTISKNDKLPFTGNKVGIIIAVVVIAGVGYVFYNRYKNLKGI